MKIKKMNSDSVSPKKGFRKTNNHIVEYEYLFVILFIIFFNGDHHSLFLK